MTRRALLLCIASCAAWSARAQDVDPASAPPAAVAQDTAPPAEAAQQPEKPLAPPVVDTTSVAEHRTPLQAMTEHFLGSTARAVRFDWRHSPVTVAALGGELLERNNFGSNRFGVLVRHAIVDVIVEGGVQYVRTYGTPSSNQLALTPYRQYGRPSHVELDLNAGYAIAEGVVTPWFAWLPPAEMALVAVGGMRYLLYPEVLPARPLLDVARDLVLPQLSDAERTRVDMNAPPGMLVDPARYHTLAGLSLDLYFQPGVYIAPRALVAVPLLAPVTGTGLGFFFELSIAAGFAF